MITGVLRLKSELNEPMMLVLDCSVGEGALVPSPALSVNFGQHPCASVVHHPSRVIRQITPGEGKGDGQEASEGEECEGEECEEEEWEEDGEESEEEEIREETPEDDEEDEEGDEDHWQVGHDACRYHW